MVTTQRPKLAVRLPNWVGDVVMALPTIAQLQLAGFDLHLVGRPWAQDLLAGLGLPFMALPKRLTAATWRLRTLPAEYGLLFTNSLSSAMSMRFAGIRAIGYKSDCRNALLHTALVKIPARHEVEYFWRLGQAVAAVWGSVANSWPDVPPRHIELQQTMEHRLNALRILSHAGIRGQYFVCCPMAAGTTLGQSKEWPLFADLCAHLSSAGKQIIICPGPGEESRCQGFKSHATVLSGLSLGAYSAVMAGAEMVIANDSGPMHLAAAVGAPVLGVFGNGDPGRTRPWGGRYLGGYGNWPSVEAVLAATIQSTESKTAPPARYSMAA
jgi:lipopolysaccharide heptosyltransferase II